MHAFRSGIARAAAALENWSRLEGREGAKGAGWGSPGFKSKQRSTPSVSFVEINHQLSWLHPDRHHVRLMLPQVISRPGPGAGAGISLGWLHTVESTSALYRLVESGEATIQKVTIAYRGGRWRASFQVRYREAPRPRPVRRPRRASSASMSACRHLATLSEPVPSADRRRRARPQPGRPRGSARPASTKLDRRIASAQSGSKSHRRLLRRPGPPPRPGRPDPGVAPSPGSARPWPAAFEVVAVEDLNLRAMAKRKRRLGRDSPTPASASCAASSPTRPPTGATPSWPSAGSTRRRRPARTAGPRKPSCPYGRRVFTCDDCGAVSDRDVNAARSIALEAARLLGQHTTSSNQQHMQDGAGLRPDSENAAPRPGKTPDAEAEGAGSPEGGTKQPPPRRAAA